MTEDNKVDVNEILDEIDQLLAGEDLEGEVTLWDLLLESLHEVVEERMIYGNHWAQVPNDNSIGEHEPCSRSDNDDIPGEYIMSSRGSGKQSRMKEYNDEVFTQIERGAMTTAEKINSIASTLGYFGKSGQSVADWVEKTYSVSPIPLDSLTDKTEERARPRKRGERCDTCSNMTKKELKKYDSCPSCGRSLFALKSRGW